MGYSLSSSSLEIKNDHAKLPCDNKLILDYFIMSKKECLPNKSTKLSKQIITEIHDDINDG